MTQPELRPSTAQKQFTAKAVQSLRRRKAVNGVMVALIVGAAVVATIPLIVITGYLIKYGAGSVQWHFFTNMPKPEGEAGGGMANAIVGTLILIALASVFGLPVGIGAGLYLAEHRGTKLANTVRFVSDVLNGLPSIVMGIFAWQFLVRPLGHFSAWAGGVALGAMMIPMVARTTEEMVSIVPVSLREAALALGYARWRTSLTIVLRTASAGIVTGALVAIARIAGETAPLLFTVLGNSFFSTSLNQPIAALPLQIFYYGTSPYEDQHAQAWAGGLVLIVLIFVISLIARYATRGQFTGTGGD